MTDHRPTASYGDEARAKRFNYLGPADMLRLDTACAPIRDAFHAHPYLVGSVLVRADYRDVDVRLVLDDDVCELMFGDLKDDPRAKLRLLLINSALSDWLARASGLPVDFQIQPVSECMEHATKPRNALAMHDVAVRYGGDDA